MEALKLSQSRLDNLQPNKHANRRQRAPTSYNMHMETKATVISSQQIGSGTYEHNAYGSGQYSLVSPQAQPNSIMQHRLSNASLCQNRHGARRNIQSRQRPITSNQRGLSVGSSTRGMFKLGRGGPGRITEKHLGLVRNSTGTSSGNCEATKDGTTALLKNQSSAITTTAHGNSSANFKSYAISRRMQGGGKTQQQMRGMEETDMALVDLNKMAAQHTSQGNIINQLSMQPSVQVEYRGGRITTKQQSHPDITMANAILQHGPQSIQSTGKQRGGQMNKQLLMQQKRGSKTQRPIYSAHQHSRQARNQSAIMTHKNTVKQKEDLEALDSEALGAMDLQVHHLSSSALNQVVSTTVENQTHQRLASESGGSEMQVRYVAGGAKTLTADGSNTYNLQTTAYGSNTGSVHHEGKQRYLNSNARQSQRTAVDSPQNIDQRSNHQITELQSSMQNPPQVAGVSDMTSPVGMAQSQKQMFNGENKDLAGLYGEAIRHTNSSGVGHYQVDVNVSDQQHAAVGLNRPLIASSMRVSEINDVIKEEHYTESNNASVSHTRLTEDAMIRETMQVATGVVDIEANLQEIKQRGLSSLQHSNFDSQGNSALALFQVPQSHLSGQEITRHVTVSTIEDPQKSYIDIEDFNTSQAQRSRMRKLLSMNVDKLMRKKKVKHQVDFQEPAFYEDHEYDQVQEGAVRLLDNLDSAMRRHRRHQTKNTSNRAISQNSSFREQHQTLPTSHISHLFLNKFVLNDKLQQIEDRQFINPDYYQKDGEFDLRKKSNGPGRKKQESHYLQSAFWNPRTHMVLTAKSEDPRPYIKTNTRSFARKFTRKAPRHRVRQAYKQEGDQPQPGYYDTKDAYDKTFGLQVVNSVNMDMEPARKDMFTGKNTVCSVDDKPLQNKWQEHEIPQAHMDFKEMMSRKDQTVDIANMHLTWMFMKSADEIARAKVKQARDDHLREMQKDHKKTAANEDQIDWTCENNLSPFTFDIMQMGNLTNLYKTGRDMIDEKVTSIVDDQKAENQRKKDEELLKNQQHD